MKPRYERDRRAPRHEKPREREAGPAASSVVYGVLPVLELLRADMRMIDKIAIAEGVHEKRLSEIFELARAKGIVISRVPRNKLNELAGEGANNQGVVAFAASASYSNVEEILDKCGQDHAAACPRRC